MCPGGFSCLRGGQIHVERTCRLSATGGDASYVGGSTTAGGFEDGVDYTNDAIFVFLEKGEIRVAANKTLRGAVVSGTPSNNDFQVYTDSIRFYRDWLDDYRERFGKAYRDRDGEALDSLNKENIVVKKKKFEVEKKYFDCHRDLSCRWIG